MLHKHINSHALNLSLGNFGSRGYIIGMTHIIISSVSREMSVECVCVCVYVCVLFPLFLCFTAGRGKVYSESYLRDLVELVLPALEVHMYIV